MGRPIDQELLDTQIYKTLTERFRISKKRLVELMEANDVDPVIFEQLMRVVLDRYRSLDVYGSKAALQREIETLIEEATKQDKEDESYVA